MNILQIERLRISVSRWGAVLLPILAATNASALTVGNFVTVDVPGATLTRPRDVNNAGVIVGQFNDAGGAAHGFMLTQGVVTTVDYPGGQETWLLSGGVFTSVDYPDGLTTDSWSITEGRDIVGDWSDTGTVRSGSVHGYVPRHGRT